VNRKQIEFAPLGLLVAALIFQSSGALASRARDSASLNLVAYSTPQDAFTAIIKAFNKTKPGKGVTINPSYGASGDQSRKVVQGLPTDVVNLALAPDVTRLVTAHIVKSNWSKNKYHGFVTDSVVVFGVRKGNPKHIKTWNDLLKAGIDVLTPNPFTSGGARWNIMAAYGSQRIQGKSHAQAVAYLKKLFTHVSVQDTSSRQELQTFVGGKGDVMLAYENEVYAAQQKGQQVDYVIPPQTILIESPAAVTTTTKYPKQASAFLNYLWTPAAQKIFGQNGYRPVRKDVLGKFHFKKPKKLFSIGKVGGWTKVEKQFFDPTSGIMVGIENQKG
jgi:sulfate/thiosulfate transport system substrate-binding protein